MTAFSDIGPVGHDDQSKVGALHRRSDSPAAMSPWRGMTARATDYTKNLCAVWPG
jgi:hypothetical protein